jgi:hypothetical protein
MRLRAAHLAVVLVLAGGVIAGLAGCGLADPVIESGQITNIDPDPNGQPTMVDECTITLQRDNGKTTHTVRWTNSDWCGLVDYGPYKLHKHGTPEVRQRQYTTRRYQFAGLLANCRPVYQQVDHGVVKDQVEGERPRQFSDRRLCQAVQAMLQGSTPAPTVSPDPTQRRLAASIAAQLKRGWTSRVPRESTPMKHLPKS